MRSLKKLGLTKYETCVYKTLLRSKKLNAKEISKQSNIPPTAVYPNLSSLKGKQLIQKIESDPAIFEILPPKAAIKNLISQRKKSLQDLENQAIEETTTIFSESPPEKEKEIIKFTKGKTFSSEVYNEAIKKVNKSLYVLGWRFEKVGNRYEYLRKLRTIVKKGIDVRIIATGKYEKNIELVEAYKKEKIKLRYFPLNNISILIIDNRECKITLKDRSLSEKHNLQILDSSLSQALQTYFLDTWEKARPI